tara:strand:- start:3437 stop:4117 length:681 start_codon:yes stop_codon:yes gene_type:complete
MAGGEIMLGINLISKPATIKKNILRALIKNLKTKIPAMRPKIETTVRGLIGKYIRLSPEYLSFGGGLLQQELGVVDPYPSLDEMIAIIANTATVTMKPIYQRSGQIAGGFTVTAVPSNFYSQVETLGQYTSKNGHKIPWLKWLLTAGDSIIIQDYRISFGGRSSQFSRTGGPIMRKSDEGWGISASNSRVPPQYSGTVNRNFVTRSMDMMLPELEKKIEAIVRSKL